MSHDGTATPPLVTATDPTPATTGRRRPGRPEIIAGFSVAVAMRVRSWRAVGVRRTTPRLFFLGAVAT